MNDRKLLTLRRFFFPIVASATLASSLVACGGATSLTVTGLKAGALLDAAATHALAITVTPHGVNAHSVHATIDGSPVAVVVTGQSAVVQPSGLGDGQHLLAIRAGTAKVTRTFTVDTTPPVLTVGALPVVTSLRSPVTISGTVTGATAVKVGTQSVQPVGDRFSVALPVAPKGLAIVATDAAGNTVQTVVSVDARHPLMRGVHLTGYGWNATVLRNPVLALARQHRINTIELDIKEEDGYVDFNTSVALAHTIHAIRVLYDPRAVVKELHAMGVRVVGRIVCFRDPKLATWAWSHGRRDWVVQAPNGKTPYKSANYGTADFTNWANADVQAYNIALAAEAARLGFDDVMFDYVRRPDGPSRTMRFPGATVSAPVGVANFVRDAAGPVHAGGAYLGLAVFGVSATRPKEVGQDISAFARYVDYMAPMVYPSHWGPGEYGVPDPNAQPYAIVNRSLKDFLARVRGTGAQIMPWLQDFSLGVHYGVPQVDAQIVGASRDGIGSFLLWNAGCVYQGRALPVVKALPRTTV